MGMDGMGWDLWAGLLYEHRFAMLITRSSKCWIIVTMVVSLFLHCSFGPGEKNDQNIHRAKPKLQIKSMWLETWIEKEGLPLKLVETWAAAISNWWQIQITGDPIRWATVIVHCALMVGFSLFELEDGWCDQWGNWKSMQVETNEKN